LELGRIIPHDAGKNILADILFYVVCQLFTNPLKCEIMKKYSNRGKESEMRGVQETKAEPSINSKNIFTPRAVYSQ